MNIKKPNALALKSHAEIGAILSGESTLCIAEAQAIARYALELEYESTAHRGQKTHDLTSTGRVRPGCFADALSV